MDIFHVARRDGATQAHEQSTRLTDRALGVLETWIDLRTRRERARLDVVIERAAHDAAPEMRARGEWWRSWRACTRRRGGLR